MSILRVDAMAMLSRLQHLKVIQMLLSSYLEVNQILGLIKLLEFFNFLMTLILLERDPCDKLVSLALHGALKKDHTHIIELQKYEVHKND